MYATYEEGDTPMNHAPSLDNIEERLSRALRPFVALPGISDQNIIGVPLSNGHLKGVVKNMLERKNGSGSV